MTTTIDYALLAGVSYRSNRDSKNRFPTPSDWLEIVGTYRNLPSSGFEAVSFTNGFEIVISYAGIDFSSLSTDFFYGNIPLALGKPRQRVWSGSRRSDVAPAGAERTFMQRRRWSVSWAFRRICCPHSRMY